MLHRAEASSNMASSQTSEEHVYFPREGTTLSFVDSSDRISGIGVGCLCDESEESTGGNSVLACFCFFVFFPCYSRSEKAKMWLLLCPGQ